MTKNNVSNGGIGSIIFGLVCLGLLVSQCDSQPGSKGYKKNQEFNQRMDARDALKARLRDPGSLQIIDERSSGNTVRIRYRAKNGFGGYNEETFIWKK